MRGTKLTRSVGALLGLLTALSVLLGLAPTPAQAATPQHTVAAQHVVAVAKAKPKKLSHKQKRLNKEVKKAKEAVAKYCDGLNVPPGKWIEKNGERYGRMYVCLRQVSEPDGEYTEINMILVPTKRVAGKKHDAVIRLWLDGYGTETYRRTVTTQAYWKQVVVNDGQTGKVWGSYKPGKKKPVNGKKQSVSRHS